MTPLKSLFQNNLTAPDSLNFKFTDMKRKCFDTLHSTHTWLKEHISEIEPDTLVIAREQTAGRGQRGNSWEAEPGKNLTFSFYLRPQNIAPRQQFAISEAIAAAIHNSLLQFSIHTKIKWPNDIYAGDRKISGILIEHAISNPDSIDRTIAGAGINVNQTTFRSDAPNPVSMSLVTGKHYSIEDVTDILCENLKRFLPLISSEKGRSELHSYFLSNLYRGDGKYYPFRIVADNVVRNAKITRVDDAGPITLLFDNGEEETFLFKEIEFILPAYIPDGIQVEE